MNESTAPLWRALREGNPLVAVYYYDATSRDGLWEESELVAPRDSRVERFVNLDAALAAAGTIALLTSTDEASVLRALETRRDALLTRTAPLVVFLHAGGSAQQALAELPGVASWLRGREYDTTWLDDPASDLDASRAKFATEFGRTPEEWLAA